ncbi:hypothetical protein PIB30_029832 [Stylosanthes scabra]|uniref:Uncharacterized protein n=1 Tax=Stylosanthes scabra TaxID=79078 RepID=A0ABU6WEY7_9FABA|nr:hypothetical protein [Stylosanthes scabra]
MEAKAIDTLVAQNKALINLLNNKLGHSSEACAAIQDQQSIEQINYMSNAPRQPNFDPYSKTFNSGWRNHSNFGWGGQGNQGEMCYNNNFQQPTLQLPTSPIHPFVSQKLS